MPGGSAASQSLHMARGKIFRLAGDITLSTSAVYCHMMNYW